MNLLRKEREKQSPLLLKERIQGRFNPGADDNSSGIIKMVKKIGMKTAN